MACSGGCGCGGSCSGCGSSPAPGAQPAQSTPAGCKCGCKWGPATPSGGTGTPVLLEPEGGGGGAATADNTNYTPAQDVSTSLTIGGLLNLYTTPWVPGGVPGLVNIAGPLPGFSVPLGSV